MQALLKLTGILGKTRAALAPPRAPVWPMPKAGPQPEHVSFTTSDGLVLKGWWFQGSADITVIMAHSFGANRSGWAGADAKGNAHRIDWRPSLTALHARGYSVLAFDHRACGESAGDLTYFGKLEALDIVAAVAHCTARGAQKIGIIGYSSGANAALRAMRILAPRTDMSLAGIAVSLYWYERMIRASTSFFTTVPLFMLPLVKKATAEVAGFDPMAEINPAKVLPEVTAPVLIVNAELDEIADLADIRAIYAARPTGSELHILAGEDRFAAYHYVEHHIDKVAEFLEGAL